MLSQSPSNRAVILLKRFSLARAIAFARFLVPLLLLLEVGRALSFGFSIEIGRAFSFGSRRDKLDRVVNFEPLYTRLSQGDFDELLNGSHELSLIFRHEGDSSPLVSSTPCPPNSMNIIAGNKRKLKVDNTG